MEHRRGTRISANLYVELSRGDRSFGISLTTNIGQGGLFIFDFEGDVVEGDLLTLKISRDSSDILSNFERKAMVVHCSENGMGLMWADNYSNFLVKVHGMNEMAA